MSAVVMDKRTRIVLLSAFYNAFLLVAKLVAGLVTGSVGVLSEAVNSATDLVASLVALFAVRRSAEPLAGLDLERLFVREEETIVADFFWECADGHESHVVTHVQPAVTPTLLDGLLETGRGISTQREQRSDLDRDGSMGSKDSAVDRGFIGQ